MKRITRMLIFSAVAIYLTALWNKGFEVNFTLSIFVRTVLIIAFFYYFIMPIAKLVLLPINLLTLGFISSLVYFILFYLVITRFSLIHIKEWDFPGLTFFGLSIQKMHVGYLTNILASSVSLSFIIQLLGILL